MEWNFSEKFSVYEIDAFELGPLFSIIMVRIPGMGWQ